ncbi:MAG: hypothetical protein JNL43_04490 [Flavobacteriales bacterium]|nr:hypothetical protein [Flavobacteriales bacterium]
MLKNTLLLSLAAPLAAFAQCTKCTSFTEAEKAPAGVVSITMNPLVTGETLDKVPTDLAQYTALKELYLTDHGLTEIPAEIGSLTTLKSLSFAGNQLKTLPDELFQLKELKELILADNAFSGAYKKELRSRVKQEMPGVMLMLD